MQTVELVGRLLIGLTVVLGVIWLIAKKARGGARQKLRTDKLIDVLGRQSLTRGSSVAVVRVAEKALIVGITDSNVRVLGEVELDAAAAYIAATDPATRPGARSGVQPAGSGSVAQEPLTVSDIDEIRARRLGAAKDVIPGGVATGGGRLSGSALSPATWKQTINALREMTARKG